MANEPISRVAIIGTGQMGPTIAVATTVAGCPTTLIGRTAESVTSGQAHFDAALGFMVEHAVVIADDAANAAGLLRTATDVAAAAEADLVVESIVEHLPTK